MMMWTPEKDDRLRAMVSRGDSFAIIGAALGVSRCSAIGRAGRIGLSKKRRFHTPESRIEARRIVKDKFNEKKRLARSNKIVIAGGLVRPAYVAIDREHLRLVEIVPRNITLIELEPHDCRYPAGETEITFCGHPQIHGSSYCPAHFALCWKEPGNRYGAKSRVGVA